MTGRVSSVALILLIGALPHVAFSQEQGDVVEAPATEQRTTQGDQDVLNVSNLTKSLREGDFWLVLVVTLVVGATGGIVYELLILQGNIEKPHKPTKEEEQNFPHAIYRFMFDLGIFARMIIGALAALVGLWVFSPNSTVSWLAVAVVSGSAGASIFNSMQDRLLAVMAQKDVTELRRSFERQAPALLELKNKLEGRAAQLEPRTLDLLAEAKGLADPWVGTGGLSSV